LGKLTRLGEFSPFRQLFTLGGFFEVIHFWATCFHINVYVVSNMNLLHFVRFFSQASGRTGDIDER
jgi:hypothetical protein